MIGDKTDLQLVAGNTTNDFVSLPLDYMDEHCSQTLALNYGSIEAVKLSLTKMTKYPSGMRCAMRIQAPEGKRLIVRIEALDIQGTQSTLCQDGDYLQIFDGPTESSITHQGAYT